MSADRRKMIREQILKQASIAPNMTFHRELPILATASGQLDCVLEFDTRHQSDKVTIYQLSIDGTCAAQQIAILVGHSSPVTAISFCPNDSSRVATGDNEGNIRIWDIHGSVDSVGSVGSVECIYFLRSPFLSKYSSSLYMISSMDWLNKTTLVASHSNGVVNFICDEQSENRFQSRSSSLSRPYVLTCLKFHPSGKFFATCGYGKIQLRDSSSLEYRSILDDLMCDIFTIEFNSLGNLLIIGCLKEILIVKVSPNGDAMSLLATQKIHNRYVVTVAVHTIGDESSVICGANGGALALAMGI